MGDLPEVLIAGGAQGKGDMCPFCGTLQALGVKAGNGAVCSNCGMDLKVSTHMYPPPHMSAAIAVWISRSRGSKGPLASIPSSTSIPSSPSGPSSPSSPSSPPRASIPSAPLSFSSPSSACRPHACSAVVLVGLFSPYSRSLLTLVLQRGSACTPFPCTPLVHIPQH